MASGESGRVDVKGNLVLIVNTEYGGIAVVQDAVLSTFEGFFHVDGLYHGRGGLRIKYFGKLFGKNF